MGWPFSRKVKLEVTDAEKAKQDFVKEKRNNPPSTQACYKLYLRYHRPGDSPFRPKLIYFLYKGRLQSTSRG